MTDISTLTQQPEPMGQKYLDRLAGLAELPCSCGMADCEVYMSALTREQAQELVAEARRARAELATVQAERAAAREAGERVLAFLDCERRRAFQSWRLIPTYVAEGVMRDDPDLTVSDLIEIVAGCGVDVTALTEGRKPAEPIGGWILWAPDGRWVHTTTSEAEDGWKAVAAVPNEDLEFRTKGYFLHRLDRHGWRAFNELHNPGYVPGTRDLWLARCAELAAQDD